MEISLYWDKLAAYVAGHQAAWAVVGKVFAAVFGSLVLWLVLRRLLKAVFRRLSAYPFFRDNPQTLEITRQGMSYVLLLVLGAYLIGLSGLDGVRPVFYAVVIILFASPAAKLARVAISVLNRRVAARSETKVDDIVFDLLNRFSGFLIYIGAAVFALDLLGINVMPIVAGAGIAGIAVGFAAKDTLSNLIAGVLLLVDRPFEEGDRIEVWSAPRGSATWGDVVSIGLRATKIRTTDNIIVVIPNNEIMTRDIINYTWGDQSIRVRVNIGVAYDTDIAKAKRIVEGVARTCEWVQDKPAPQVVVRNFGESSVDLQARLWIRDARKRMATISYITDQVKARFDQEGVEIPYPRRDVVIRHAPGLP
ncbi:MAG: mechanosensitive ion channel family protein [Deltaproteobacteria bacterium]|nr:mechanosensitive ion channel family protein [Deltaproteobacteria bacterium]